MSELLERLYNEGDHAIFVVSSYDNTTTYVSPAAARLAPVQMPDPDLRGHDFEQLMKYWGLDDTQVPILRCLQHSPDRPTEHNRSPFADGWWIASPVPCSDPNQPEVFGSVHPDVRLERALREHEVMIERTAIALEYERCRRLQNAGMAAFIDAQRRLDWIGELLTSSGHRPINPSR